MQAGLTTRRLTFREIFSPTVRPLSSERIACVVAGRPGLLRLAA
ncbi:MAG: hypothetical protein O7J95_01000 [Planctomycetota bacterium]|nr:hypothetical protein [Planctomycetota bacterium]